ncbi:MAG: hypothetical protein WAN50_04450 [Minisyncoccia bacterium]
MAKRVKHNSETAEGTVDVKNAGDSDRISISYTSQLPEFAEYWQLFGRLTGEEQQWVIANKDKAIDLFVDAIKQHLRADPDSSAMKRSDP